MVSTGYLFERFCWLTFSAHLFMTALTNPAYYGHLTYWMLLIHAIYFTIDKESPNATFAIYAMHGVSFCGAMGVFLAYAFITCGGLYRFGSYLEWENAIGAAAGTVHHDRGFFELVLNKLYEHLWPVIALILDSYLSKDALRRAYVNAHPRLTTFYSVAGFLAYGLCWEQFSKATKGGSLGSSLEVYVQPNEWRSSRILAALGLNSVEGMPEDFIFAMTQKILVPSFAFLMYRVFIWPILPRPRATAGAGVVKARRSTSPGKKRK